MNVKAAFIDGNIRINHFVSRDASRIFLLLFSLQLPSLAPIFKYLSVDMYWFLPCYLITLCAFYFFLFSTTHQPLFLQKLLNSPLSMLILLALFLLLNAVLYHHQLMLQSLGKGTDAGDALAFTGYNLVHGHFPYSRLTYLGNFVSAGPGLFMMALPFTYIGAYGLLIPLLVVFSALIIKTITQSFSNANIYILCLLSSPAFMQSLGQGNDYLIIGLTYALITIALYYYWGKNGFYNACFILSVGLLATVRLNFFYLALVLGFFLWKRDKKSGVYFALLSFFVTLLVHFLFYQWSPTRYMPLHVINDYAVYTTHNIYGLSTLIFFCGIVGMITLIKLTNNLTLWLFYLWICLLTPLLIGGFFCLLHQHWDVQGIGLGYITLTAPILMMAIMLNFNKVYSPPKKIDYAN